MTTGLVLFLILGLVSVVSAIGMITARNAIHAAMFLVLNFLTIALFYIGLSAPFLAMVQITVYAGAIMVLFIFVIMLLGAERVSFQSTLKAQPILAFIMAGALLVTSGFIFLNPQTNPNQAPPTLGERGVLESQVEDSGEAFGTPRAVGFELYESYMLPFQIVGLLLLVAMIGAVVLSQQEAPVPGEEPARRRYVDPDSLRVGSLTDTAQPAGDK
jgi:NADH-quinone oxidoreductase subunit J